MRVIATAAALLACGCAQAAADTSAADPAATIVPQLQAIEARSGGRLGVALADSDGRIVAGHRTDERFAFCSTFKLLLAGMVLDGQENGRWSLDERLPVTRDDLVYHSPVTETRVDDGWISIRDAASAIVTISDNAAANLLVQRLGGADAFNAWLRGLGDASTRLDRPESGLNANHAGDPRDTTTPGAIASSASRLIFGDALAPAQRQMLRGWLVASETGLNRIRAGLPETHLAGDKTGTCGARGRKSYNDVAFIVPDLAAGDQGYVLAVYLDRPSVAAEEADRRIAEVAATAAGALAR